MQTPRNHKARSAFWWEVKGGKDERRPSPSHQLTRWLAPRNHFVDGGPPVPGGVHRLHARVLAASLDDANPVIRGYLVQKKG